MLRSIIAVSKDGYMTRKVDDDMQWLGQTDKKIFRLLTASSGIIATSKKTAALMPKALDGRRLFTLSREFQGTEDGVIRDLKWFYRNFGSHQAWLIGGQELLLVALKERYIGEVHICRSSRNAYPPSHYKSIKDKVSDFLEKDTRWYKTMETWFLDVQVHCWRFL